MEKITVDNAADICIRLPETGDTKTKANAWSVVYEFLRQKGMKGGYKSKRVDRNMSGIENAISFLETNLKKRITP